MQSRPLLKQAQHSISHGRPNQTDFLYFFVLHSGFVSFSAQAASFLLASIHFLVETTFFLSISNTVIQCGDGNTTVCMREGTSKHHFRLVLSRGTFRDACERVVPKPKCCVRLESPYVRVASPRIIFFKLFLVIIFFFLSVLRNSVDMYHAW